MTEKKIRVVFIRMYGIKTGPRKCTGRNGLDQLACQHSVIMVFPVTEVHKWVGIDINAFQPLS